MASIDEIKKAYEAQRAATNDSMNNQIAQINQDVANAAQTYQPVRDSAYIQQQLDEARRRENMANMGMSGAGGTSATLQQRNSTTMLNTLGSADRQQQAYVDTLGLKSMDVKTAYAKALADIQAAETTAITNQSNLDREADYQMVRDGRMSIADFNKKYGYTLTKPSSGGGGGGYAVWTPPTETTPKAPNATPYGNGMPSNIKPSGTGYTATSSTPPKRYDPTTGKFS